MKQLHLKRILVFLYENFKLADRIFEQKIRGKFMNVVMANQWKRRRKRYGGDINLINRNNIRKNITFQMICWVDLRSHQSFQILKPFF